MAQYLRASAALCCSCRESVWFPAPAQWLTSVLNSRSSRLSTLSWPHICKWNTHTHFFKKLSFQERYWEVFALKQAHSGFWGHPSVFFFFFLISYEYPLVWNLKYFLLWNMCKTIKFNVLWLLNVSTFEVEKMESGTLWGSKHFTASNKSSL